ncbi:MAG: DUF4221 family protein [Lunatimonas sp.]|uniref:DUF4221 family protein n=1 Tax=Lunatimonas sp. TaxID=2060141 RepID=UPI00263BACA7|nr:DUF4221 family protein [Lunatimonas sp.]MCC5939824.1 DUF4221 family protein [Lunatimonas sp.]
MVISACETEVTSKNTILSESNIIIDTVLIDPGDQLVFPYVVAERSFFTEDNRYLFNFNDFDHTLEKIDLDKLELTEKYPFEKEGPHGTGNYVDYLVPLDSDRLLIQASSQAGIFDWAGSKLGEFDPLLEGASLTHVERKAFQPVRAVGGRIYGLIVDNGANTSEVGYVDLTEGEFSTIPLAKEFRHGDFNLEHREGNTRRRYAPEFHIQAFHKENWLIVGSTVSSRLYIFDPEIHQFSKREYNLRLTANKKEGVYTLDTEDEALFQRAYVSLHEEVTFGPLLWDADGERYYRFYYELTFPKEHTSATFPNANATFMYLMVMDRELNLLAEMPIPQLEYTPYFSFAKDSNIWIATNLEDELGFVRLTVSSY